MLLKYAAAAGGQDNELPINKNMTDMRRQAERLGVESPQEIGE